MKQSLSVVLCASAAVLMVAPSAPAHALNYFELEVYPYQTASKGELELENNTTYTARGTSVEGEPEENRGLTRSSFEVNYGVTDSTEVALYGDYARERGGSWEHKGTRVHARTRFAEKGEWAVDTGLYMELEFPRGEENDVELELRGILEKDFGRWTFDFNPILEKVIRGKEDEGWELQYAAAVRYRVDEHWEPRLEFFGDFGPIRHFEPRDEQKHLIAPAVLYRANRNLKFQGSVAFGMTDASEKRLYRLGLEWEF